MVTDLQLKQTKPVLVLFSCYNTFMLGLWSALVLHTLRSVHYGSGADNKSSWKAAGIPESLHIYHHSL